MTTTPVRADRTAAPWTPAEFTERPRAVTAERHHDRHPSRQRAQALDQPGGVPRFLAGEAGRLAESQSASDATLAVGRTVLVGVAGSLVDAGAEAAVAALTFKCEMLWALLAELTHACPLRCGYCSNRVELVGPPAELMADVTLPRLRPARHRPWRRPLPDLRAHR
ncbi:hypothetical protein [Streptomyces sp. NPDC054834]